MQMVVTAYVVYMETHIWSRLEKPLAENITSFLACGICYGNIYIVYKWMRSELNKKKFG